MSTRYIQEPFTAACPKCGTAHTMSSKPSESGRRKDTNRAPCRVYSVKATGGQERIDVYCWQCWLDIGAPETGHTRTCVACGRVGTGQYQFNLHPETGALEWRCSHAERCGERAYPPPQWAGPIPMCRFTRSDIHEPATAPATHTVQADEIWSMVCDACADYIREHDTRSGVAITRNRTEGTG